MTGREHACRPPHACAAKEFCGVHTGRERAPVYVAPLAFAEVTMPAELLGDLEAWLLARRWTLRQRPNDDLAWYAVPVIGEPDA